MCDRCDLLTRENRELRGESAEWRHQAAEGDAVGGEAVEMMAWRAVIDVVVQRPLGTRLSFFACESFVENTSMKSGPAADVGVDRAMCVPKRVSIIDNYQDRDAGGLLIYPINVVRLHHRVEVHSKRVHVPGRNVEPGNTTGRNHRVLVGLVSKNFSATLPRYEMGGCVSKIFEVKHKTSGAFRVFEKAVEPFHSKVWPKLRLCRSSGLIHRPNGQTKRGQQAQRSHPSQANLPPREAHHLLSGSLHGDLRHQIRLLSSLVSVDFRFRLRPVRRRLTDCRMSWLRSGISAAVKGRGERNQSRHYSRDNHDRLPPPLKHDRRDSENRERVHA